MAKTITREEFYAELEAIAAELESGKLKHMSRYEVASNTEKYSATRKEVAANPELYPLKGFNMNFWLMGGPDCGSVCCIGGFFEMRNPKIKIGSLLDVLGVVDYRRLADLYYRYDVYNSNPSPAAAAKAIRRFIAGYAPWENF